MKTVFFGTSWHVAKYGMYKDIVDDPTIEYCVFDTRQVGKGLLKSLLYNGRKGKYLPFLVKNYLYKKTLKYNFLVHNDIYLFVFSCQYGMFLDCKFYTFIKFLKQKYKKSKFVFYFNDIIAKFSTEQISEIHNLFDLILTFDKNDAVKYNMTYYGIIHSKLNLPQNPTVEESDIFYVGDDSGRFDTILNSFKVLSNLGKRCVFYISGIQTEHIDKLNSFIKLCQKAHKGNDITCYFYKNSVLYINIICPYDKTLQYISKTKCMIDILLPTQTAGTLRSAEAVMYQKKLITNQTNINTQPYYRQENICIFDAPRDISVEFLNTQYKPVEYNFSPLKMIEYVKTKLNMNSVK